MDYNDVGAKDEDVFLERVKNGDVLVIDGEPVWVRHDEQFFNSEHDNDSFCSEVDYGEIGKFL